MKTAFLLGAGASKGAGLPLADELTSKVLNDEFDILKSGNNPPNQPPDLKSTSQSVTQSILPFLRWIKVQVECAGTSDNHVPNYEDFAYVAVQIRDYLLGEFDNPAVHPLIQRALSEIWPLLPSDKDPCLEQLREIADETVRYITKVVVQAVSNHATDFSYFWFLTEVPPRSNECRLNIFTLNNDILVERFLSTNGNRFIDGFDPPFPAHGNWKPAVFEQNGGSDTIRLFKLHGSINWFRCRWPPKSRRDKFCRIAPDNASRRQKWKIDPRSIPEGSPEILLGVFNKMLQYTGALYLPLHYWFYRELETTDALVVCGYSFGDKGINQRIANWLDGKQHRKMAIIDACTEEELWKKARKVMCIGRERWLGNKQLALFLKNKLECVDWNDVWRRIK